MVVRLIYIANKSMSEITKFSLKISLGIGDGFVLSFSIDSVSL